VQQALSALDKLAQYGYVVNTPARADRAIRHWQRANGLVVDGIVGAQTLGSLDLPATATVPAVRVSPPAVSAAQSVEGLIRAAWPDDSEAEAVRIATRESRLVPTARNACCYGLMQIHWQAHRGWLAELGITSSAQLLDAETNIAAALALFQRSGWAPWAL
jgi:soluble lytic murein transglycosylase-like protein